MKRLFDIIIAVTASLMLSPLLLVLIFMIWLTQGNVIFFKQLRPGKHAKPFNIYKFCTMTNCCDATGCLLPDSQRLTKLGKLLRSTSLDELPELFNVIKGEMSIVGPRPLLMQYIGRYTPEQARRHELRPGLTGWAQVNGRNAISWEEKFKLDVWYVDHQSVWLDLKIIALTLTKVLKREGISHDGHATMEEFWGTPRKALS